MSLEPAKKATIITGVGAGLERGISELYFKRGCSVFLTDVSGASEEELAAKLNAGKHAVEGQCAMAATLEVPSEQLRAKVVDAGKNAFGKIDVLVCSASIRTVAPLMKAQGGGSMAFTASTGAVRSGARLSVYCASKGTVRMLCKSFALELLPFNIRVNMVSIGTCDSPINSLIATEIHQSPESIGEMSPIGPFAKHLETAEAVVFLASDRSSYNGGRGRYCGWRTNMQPHRQDSAVMGRTHDRIRTCRCLGLQQACHISATLSSVVRSIKGDAADQKKTSGANAVECYRHFTNS